MKLDKTYKTQYILVEVETSKVETIDLAIETLASYQ